MKHFASPDFWSCYHQLSAQVQKLADACYDLLKANPSHPSLHFKKVGRFRSVRVDVDLESEESLYAIEKGLSETICRAARERGVSPHTLINLWLQEKIQKLKLGSQGR